RAGFAGPESATSAGAGVAVTRDSDAIWYNPAGLGGLERSKLNANLSAFIFRYREAKGVVRTELPGETLSIDTQGNQFLSLPAAVSLVRRGQSNFHWGLGIFAF